MIEQERRRSRDEGEDSYLVEYFLESFFTQARAGRQQESNTRLINISPHFARLYKLSIFLPPRSPSLDRHVPNDGRWLLQLPDNDHLKLVTVHDPYYGEKHPDNIPSLFAEFERRKHKLLLANFGDFAKKTVTVEELVAASHPNTAERLADGSFQLRSTVGYNLVEVCFFSAKKTSRGKVPLWLKKISNFMGDDADDQRVPQPA